MILKCNCMPVKYMVIRARDCKDYNWTLAVKDIAYA